MYRSVVADFPAAPLLESVVPEPASIA